MSLPLTYTEHSLAVYMQALLGPIADIAGITVGEAEPGDFESHIDQIKLELGVDAITQERDLKRARVYAAYFAWMLAVERLSPLYGLKFEGAALDRDQIYTHARERFALAEYRLLRYDDGYAVRRERGEDRP